MSKINDAREKVEQAEKLLAEAKAELKAAEQPAEVWAYIGTRLVDGDIVVGWDHGEDTNYHCQVYCPKGLGYWHPNPTINGQPVTHFQPIKAEIEYRPNESEGRQWLAYVNGESIGFWTASGAAIMALKALAKAIAPWWNGELVITERG